MAISTARSLTNYHRAASRLPRHYLIINDQFDVALEALQALVRSLRLRTGQQQSALQDLIEDLLT